MRCVTSSSFGRLRLQPQRGPISQPRPGLNGLDVFGGEANGSNASLRFGTRCMFVFHVRVHLYHRVLIFPSARSFEVHTFKFVYLLVVVFEGRRS